MVAPDQINIYHIVNIDRLESILSEDRLYCDRVISMGDFAGTNIGMQAIKERRLQQAVGKVYDGLCVGSCVPFYFCPRSVMLYMIHKRNEGLQWRGGQEPIIHLVADFYDTVAWAKKQKKRWAFTDSNAGSSTFKSYYDINDFDKLDWPAIVATDWSLQETKHKKQAEFLLEEDFPISLLKSIGVYSEEYRDRASKILNKFKKNTNVEVKRDWYY